MRKAIAIALTAVALVGCSSEITPPEEDQHPTVYIDPQAGLIYNVFCEEVGYKINRLNCRVVVITDIPATMERGDT